MVLGTLPLKIPIYRHSCSPRELWTSQRGQSCLQVDKIKQNLLAHNSNLESFTTKTKLHQDTITATIDATFEVASYLGVAVVEEEDTLDKKDDDKVSCVLEEMELPVPYPHSMFAAFKNDRFCTSLTCKFSPGFHEKTRLKQVSRAGHTHGGFACSVGNISQLLGLLSLKQGECTG